MHVRLPSLDVCVCVCSRDTQSRGAIKNRLRVPSSFLAADGAAEEIEKKQAQRRELSAVERTPRIITSSSFSWQLSKEEAKQQQQLESFKRRKVFERVKCVVVVPNLNDF